MTIDDAFNELGLSRDAPPDLVRRTYLRLVRTRKPDVDPEGFARLRNAYEIARGTLDPSKAGALNRQHARPGPAHAAGGPDDSDPAAAAGVATDAPADRSFESTVASFATLATYADLVLAGRRLVADHPEDPRAWIWLAAALTEEGKRREAAEVYREGNRRGVRGLIEELCSRLPFEVTSEEASRLVSLGRLDLLCGLGLARMDANDGRGAYEVALIALGARLEPDELSFVSEWFSALVLRLTGWGMVDEARAVADGYSACRGAGRAEIGEAARELNEEWRIALEFIGVVPSLPRGMAPVLVRGLTDGDVDRFRDEMNRYVRFGPDAETLFAATEEIRRVAPSLYARVEGVLLDALKLARHFAVAIPRSNEVRVERSNSEPNRGSESRWDPVVLFVFFVVFVGWVFGGLSLLFGNR